MLLIYLRFVRPQLLHYNNTKLVQPYSTRLFIVILLYNWSTPVRLLTVFKGIFAIEIILKLTLFLVVMKMLYNFFYILMKLG